MTVTTRAAGPFDLEVFYDGACPSCAREVRLLGRLDRSGRIRFTDFAAAGFDAAAAGLSMPALLDRIHARLADGAVVEGVEVFRRVSAVLGHAWLAALSRLPGVRQLLDAAYRRYARRRVRSCELPPPDGVRR
jgi:predicted DCC family thiol-disulfide oxidoreductase YuxK